MKKNLCGLYLFVAITCFGQKNENKYQLLLNRLRCHCQEKYIENRNSIQRHFPVLKSNDSLCFEVNTEKGIFKICIKNNPEFNFEAKKMKVYKSKFDTLYFYKKEQIFGVEEKLIASKNISISAYFNNQKLNINANEFEHFFNVDFSSIELYESPKNKSTYLYAKGGKKENLYAVKWIFEYQKYIANIIADKSKYANFNFLDGMQD